MARTSISTPPLTLACLFCETLATADSEGNSNQDPTRRVLPISWNFPFLNDNQLRESPLLKMAQITHRQHNALPLTAPARPKFRLPHLPLSALPDLAAHRRTENSSNCAMTTISIRATYTEQATLDAFFGRLFGYGKASVLVRRPLNNSILLAGLH